MPKRLHIQGHRGARGLYPENTIDGFIQSIALGVDSIELDVVISSDRKVVVSHEAWMNADFCSFPGGNAVSRSHEKEYNLFGMPYSEIRQFVCGKRGNVNFPQQLRKAAYKPLLREVIDCVETYVPNHRIKAPEYSFEIKTESGVKGFNPEPDEFVDLVRTEITALSYDRYLIKSFDESILNEVHRVDPNVRTGLLVENEYDLALNLGRLNYLPQHYEPEFILVDSKLVEAVHHKGMKLYTWTVNESDDMKRLIDLGVDGIISDYPDRLINLFKNNS